jgi:hypothetical protein
MELVNGGWVMHDEAIASYEAQIHQMRTVCGSWQEGRGGSSRLTPQDNP